jgi:hypothetical protein
MKRLYWTAISNQERVKALDDLNSILDRHAIILNFNRFSDLSMGLVLEIAPQKVDLLYHDLSEVLAVEGYETINYQAGQDVLLFLNVTFAKGIGDLEIEVPNFPE